jgi:MOSC domain-containing protein YiiM
VRPFASAEKKSAIDKQLVDGRVRIIRLGLEGDSQADKRHHGGLERAVHHYPAEHYAIWRDLLPTAAERFVAPGFGENISTEGMRETQVCIGDVYRLGTAIVQVSQPRTPCTKLDDRFHVSGMAQRVEANRLTGWFYKVLIEGLVAPGDVIELLERPNPGFTVDRVMYAIYHVRQDPAMLEALVALKGLSEGWRAKAHQRLERKRAQD